MRKQEFLDTLKARLADLPAADVAERLNFYSEMIDDRIEEGLDEEAAVAAIGSVEEIAAQIKADTPLLKAIVTKLKNKKRLSSTEVVLLVIGSPLWLTLLLAALAVVVSVYASAWAVLISLWATGVALIGGALGGVLSAVFTLIQSGAVPAVQILLSLALISAGLAIFFFFGCKWTTKGVLWLTKKVAALIKRRAVGKEA